MRLLLNKHLGLSTYSMYPEETRPDYEEFRQLIGHLPRPASVAEMRLSEQIYFVKTHDLPTDSSPSIYLVRDGRDALVSYAHFILAYEVQGYAGTNSDEAFRNTLHDLIAYNASFGGWGANVSAWSRRDAQTVIVKYETLIKSPDQVALSQLLHSLDIRLEITHTEIIPSFDELHGKYPAFFRAGKTGNWKTEMPPELEELFWKKNGQVMEMVGYSR